jgi:hypothetical protein
MKKIAADAFFLFDKGWAFLLQTAHRSDADGAKRTER